MAINWIKCSERMPPDDELLPVIAKHIGGDPEETVLSGAWFNFMARSYSQEKEPSWMPYDEETWEMLTDKTRTKKC